MSRRAGATVRTVAWLCMAGVGIGVFSLVVVISVMYGFNDQIRGRLLAVEPHLIVSIPGVNESQALAVHPIYTKLKNINGLQTDIFEQQDVIIRTVDGLFGGAVAKGVEAKSLGYVLRENRRSKKASRPSAGADIELPPISDESSQLQPGEVIVGVDLAKGLGIFEGDRIVIISPEALLLPESEVPPFERVTVKGLITTHVPDIDAKTIFYGRGETFVSLGRSASLQSGYELRNPENIDSLKMALQADGANVETWMERNSSLFFALKMEKIVIGVFLGLSGLIAGFSIITVLLLLLTQKRKDIGLLMSLGLSPRRTRALFVRVGLYLSFIGIGSGLLAGVLVCILIDNTRITVLPEVYIDATIPARVDPFFLLGILVVSGLVAFLSAWWPARTVTKESPADALRGTAAVRARQRSD
jgi:lipoprotein-releasing system permease protein